MTRSREPAPRTSGPRTDRPGTSARTAAGRAAEEGPSDADDAGTGSARPSSLSWWPFAGALALTATGVGAILLPAVL